MNLNDTDLSFAVISRIENQIIFVRFRDADQVGLEAVKKLDKTRLNLANHQPFISFVSFENVFGTMTKSAQRYLAKESPACNLIIHEIIIINSLPVRLLVKYYIKQFKPKFKITIVKNRSEGQKIIQSISTPST